MLGKDIKHFIKKKKKRRSKNQEIKWVQIVAKNYIYTLKPQIQGAKIKQRKRRTWTLPFDVQKKVRIQRFLYVLRREFREKERERNCPENGGGVKGIYGQNLTFWLLAALQGPLASFDNPLGCVRLTTDFSNFVFFNILL